MSACRYLLWRNASARTVRWRRCPGGEKKCVHAARRDTERVVALRSALVEAVQRADFTRCKFVDETSTNLTYCRRYARAEGGQRARQARPGSAVARRAEETLVAALTTTGLQAAMTVSGAVNGAVFAVYLQQVIGLMPVPSDVARSDNLPAHKVAGLAELGEARGARRRYLPPYSPDFNPIELTFSKYKTWLRTARVCTREALESVIHAATDWITERNAQNWVGHCGYHIH